MGARIEGRTEEAPASRRQSSCGVLLIDKPVGPTSHDVVAWVRWALGERSVGHCGTLDPVASGLLVVCIGAATKLVRYLQEVDKVYRASIVLGVATTTADVQGEVVRRADVDAGAMARAPGVLRDMVGRLRLVPPAYSAIRLQGRRAHELARTGETVELAPREMVLGRVEDIAVEPPAVAATLTVSKGTYVRSLAEELGRRLGMPAHLGSLRRLASGRLALEHPSAVTELVGHPWPAASDGAARWRIRPRSDPGDGPVVRRRCGSLLAGALVSPVDALPFPVLHVQEGPRGEDALVRLGQGQGLDLDHPGLATTRVLEHLGTHVGVCGPRGELLVARVERAGEAGSRLSPERVVVAPGAAP